MACTDVVPPSHRNRAPGSIPMRRANAHPVVGLNGDRPAASRRYARLITSSGSPLSQQQEQPDESFALGQPVGACRQK